MFGSFQHQYLQLVTYHLAIRFTTVTLSNNLSN